MLLPYKKIVLSTLLLSIAIGGWVGYRTYTYTAEQERVKKFQHIAFEAYGKYAQQDNVQALRLYEAAIALYPKDERSLNNLASLYRTKGEHAKARDFYAKAFEINKDDFNAGYNLALSDFILGSYEKSLQQTQWLLNHDGQKWKYYRLMSISLWHLNKQEDALGYYAYLHENNQYKKDTLLAPIAEKYDSLSKKTPVKSILFAYEEIEEQEMLEKLVKEYIAQSYDMKAFKTVLKILSKDPTNYFANKTAAELLFTHGELVEAYRYTQKIDAHDARMYEIQGAALQRMQSYDAAIAAYEKSYALKQSDDLLRAMSVCAAKSGDEAKFLRFTQELAQRNPGLADKLIYALETSAGVEHSLLETVLYLTLQDWYTLQEKLQKYIHKPNIQEVTNA